VRGTLNLIQVKVLAVRDELASPHGFLQAEEGTLPHRGQALCCASQQKLNTKIEEIFYVLEGELDLRCGERTLRGGPGTCVFVPPGAAHAFGNSGSSPGRMLLITAPPGHEKYFDELRDLIAKGGKPDPDALAKLRAKYDTVQLATLTPG
jgi:mannose-6-phosphate isomerase-like protein (cupin superfamily)